MSRLLENKTNIQLRMLLLKKKVLSPVRRKEAAFGFQIEIPYLEVRHIIVRLRVVDSVWLIGEGDACRCQQASQSPFEFIFVRHTVPLFTLSRRTTKPRTLMRIGSVRLPRWIVQRELSVHHQ